MTPQATSSGSSGSPSSFFDTVRTRGAQFLLWRGILAAVMGVLLIFFPFESAIVLSIFIGAWMIIDGLVAAGMALDQRKEDLPWGWTMTEGVLMALAGLAVLFLPGLFAVVGAFFILGFMAVGLIVTGVVQLGIPKEARSGWTIAGGVVNIIFGVLLGVLAVANPVENVWTLAWVAGVYALVMGITAIVVSVRMRRSH